MSEEFVNPQNMPTDTPQEPAGQDTPGTLDKSLLVGGNPTPSDGTQQADKDSPWWETLPDELKNEPTVQKYKSVEEAIKGLVNATKLIGRDKVPVPKPDAPKEEWDAFYQAIGRPDTPDGYEIQYEGADEEILNSFKQAAHEAGLTPQQVQKIADFWKQTEGQLVEKYEQLAQQQQMQTVQQLQKEWGSKFNAELDTAKKAVRALCDDETIQLLNSTGLGNDVRIVKLFNKLGKMLTEDQLGSLDNVAADTLSAKQELQKLKGDKEFIKILENPFHPEHEAAKAKFRKLHEIIFGGK